MYKICKIKDTNNKNKTLKYAVTNKKYIFVDLKNGTSVMHEIAYRRWGDKTL